MKRYAFGLLAIVVAIIFISFSVGNKINNSPLLVFEYFGDDESGFCMPSNWQLDATPDIECDEFPDVKTVCVLWVDQSIAYFVTEESSLTYYLSENLLNTFSRINNAEYLGIIVMEIKARQ